MDEQLIRARLAMMEQMLHELTDMVMQTRRSLDAQYHKPPADLYVPSTGDEFSVWERCVTTVERQIPLSAAGILRATRLHSIHGDTLSVAVTGGAFAVDRLQSRYDLLLREAYRQVTGKRVTIKFFAATDGWGNFPRHRSGWRPAGGSETRL